MAWVIRFSIWPVDRSHHRRNQWHRSPVTRGLRLLVPRCANRSARRTGSAALPLRSWPSPPLAHPNLRRHDMQASSSSSTRSARNSHRPNSVNCAAAPRTPTLDVPEAEWNSIMETNLSGTLRACRMFGRHMIANRYGRIVNIASISSLVSFSKSPLTAQARPLSRPYKIAGHRMGDVRIVSNALVPACFARISTRPSSTNRAWPRVSDANPYARFAISKSSLVPRVFLASDAASYVTGGCSVVSSRCDRSSGAH